MANGIELDTHNVGVLAISADGKFAGLGFSNELGETFPPVQLVPTVSIAGKLVDEDGNPLANVKLVQHHDNNRAVGTHLTYLTTTTDKDGNFSFDSVITGLEQKMAVKMERGGIRFVGGNKVYQPGENHSDIKAVYRDYSRRVQPKTGREKEAPKEIFERKFSSTKSMIDAAHMHGLIIVSREADKDSNIHLLSQIMDSEISEEMRPLHPQIYDYLPLQYELAGSDISQESKQLLELLAHSGGLPGINNVIFIATDAKGKPLGSTWFKSDDKDVEKIKTSFRSFLTQHAPEKRNAKLLFEAALTRAKSESKSVFVKVGGPRCGPCMRMNAWLQQQQAILEKDFVLFGFHAIRCEHGIEIAEQLAETPKSSPWFCILNSDGKEVINSEGPLGNIGFPAGEDEGIKHFIEMISKSRKNITDEEIETLRSSLKNWK